VVASSHMQTGPRHHARAKVTDWQEKLTSLTFASVKVAQCPYYPTRWNLVLLLLLSVGVIVTLSLESCPAIAIQAQELEEV
jgi:hypothetical protein